LQCVAVCCSVLQCVEVSCSVLQCLAVSCSVLQCLAECVYKFLEIFVKVGMTLCESCVGTKYRLYTNQYLVCANHHLLPDPLSESGMTILRNLNFLVPCRPATSSNNEPISNVHEPISSTHGVISNMTLARNPALRT